MNRHEAAGQAGPRPFWADTPVRTARRGHFWIAGERVRHVGKTFQRGPMFLQWEAPTTTIQPGNGHGLIYERNSDAALRPVLAWLDRLADRMPPDDADLNDMNTTESE